MRLYLCEKPSQAADLAKVLGCTQSQKGFRSDAGQSTIVTWAIGHLFEIKMPDDYDPALKQWSLDSLPFIPPNWNRKLRKDVAEQYKIIKGLLDKLAKANGELVIATDADREGEAIARHVIQQSRYQGRTKRLKLSSLDAQSIRRALADVQDGHTTMGLYHAAEARARADYLVGMNFSRLYTLLGREIGMRDTCHVGRVSVPTIQLVVTRDQEIANFKSKPYYEVFAQLLVASGQFKAKWQPVDELLSPDGHCLDPLVAQSVAQKIAGRQGKLVSVDTKKSAVFAPLPFDLATLQRFADKELNLSLEEALKMAQSLYDAKLITYPRTECRYLPASQACDAQNIFASLSQLDELSGVCVGVNLSDAPRCFDDKKMEGYSHHGIIPALDIDPASVNQLSSQERTLFMAVARQYIAQFHPPYRALKTVVMAEVEGEAFVARGSIPQALGWHVCFERLDQAQSGEKQASENDNEEDSGQLPSMTTGEMCRVGDQAVENKMTRPSPHFTEATLLSAMENIARFEPNPKYKAILSESSGLGTPATRHEPIKNGLLRGYLRKDKRLIKATPKAAALCELLPPILRSPGLTATWELKFKDIEEGRLSLSDFDKAMSHWISQVVRQVKLNMANSIVQLKQSDTIQNSIQASAEAKKSNHDDCPACGGKAYRNKYKEKKGFYWRCSACNGFFDDKKGKPALRPIKT